MTTEQTRSHDPAGEPNQGSCRACLFSLCGETLAIDVGQVYEVVQEAAVTPLPQVPLGLAGVINFRGEILPLIDLAPWLTSSTRPPGGTMSAMVVQANGTQLSLRIDAINDVAELQEMFQAEAEILRPGLEHCLIPVAAASFQGTSVSARKTIWYLSIERLFDRLIEVFSTSRKDV
ncbi:MAG: chemotaxis protein CheW [Nitrospirota bacterium]